MSGVLQYGVRAYRPVSIPCRVPCPVTSSRALQECSLSNLGTFERKSRKQAACISLRVSFLFFSHSCFAPNLPPSLSLPIPPSHATNVLLPPHCLRVFFVAGFIGLR